MGFPKTQIKSFFDARFNMPVFNDFVDKQIHKRLPPHTGWPHVFGSLSLMLFLNQVITGILLMISSAPGTKPSAGGLARRPTSARIFSAFFIFSSDPIMK